MEIASAIFKLLAGIGLFLFAMYLIEEALKNLSGRNFKIFLQRITKNKFGAISGGAIVTGVLQSSSMVSLMVLAFVGAGVFTMRNAMAIILGANLGTTLDSWVVATLGFRFNIEAFSYPAVFIGGILLITFSSRKTIKYYSWFLLGFGLLFIGLTYMKAAMEAQTFDFSNYAEMPSAVFLLIGFIITLLVQSSSVTMALTLSALHAGTISFPIAAAIVLGSETGTTIKLALGAIGGNVSKKRVVLGNILFNVVLTILAFIFLNSILYLITDIFAIHDHLIGLVTFSTLVNLLGIFLFLPFLDRFTDLLEHFFKDTDASAAAFIGHANVEVTDSALDLFRKETEYFIYDSMLFNLMLFEIDTKAFDTQTKFRDLNEKRKYLSKTTEERYDFLKQFQGELQVFYLELRTKLQNDKSAELAQLISAVRNSMHSVKSIKDIRSNINDLKRSSKDIKFDFFIFHKKKTEHLYEQLNSFVTKKDKIRFSELQFVYDEVKDNYNSALNNFYMEAENATVEDLDITTAINFNRELYTSNKAMLMAIRDLLLEEKQAEDFS